MRIGSSSGGGPSWTGFGREFQAPLYSRRTILFASNQSSLDRLMGLLRRRGTSPVAVVCGPRLYEQFKVKCTWSYSGWSHDAVRHGKLLGYALYRRAARAA